MTPLEQLYLFNPALDPALMARNATYDSSKYIAELFTPAEERIVEEGWNTPGGPAEQGWKSRPIGWLLDTSKGLIYGQTEYAKYFAVAKNKSIFSPTLRQQLTASVGCAVLSADGYYLVQQRAESLLAGRRLDSSAAGMAIIREGKLNFEFEMKEKLKRELHLTEEMLNGTLVPTGVHGAVDYLSSQATWRCEVAIPLDELVAKTNPTFIERMHAVHKDDLPEYLIKHYVPPGNEPEKSLIGDAVGVFLRSLDAGARNFTIERLNSQGADIRLGVLRNGRFEEE